MKTKLITALVILVMPLQLIADNYITLNGVLSINIPGSYPDTFSRGKLQGFGTYYNACFYEALSRKEPKIKADVLTNMALDSYYDDFTKQWLQQMGGTLIEQNSFNVRDYMGRYIYYEALNEANLPQLWHTEIILVDKVVYVFSINAAKGKRKQVQSNSFSYFGSLCFEEDRIAMKQEEENYSKQNKILQEKYQKEFDEKQKKEYSIQHIKWLISITALSIFIFVIAIAAFFIIRYYYNRYDK